MRARGAATNSASLAASSSSSETAAPSRPTLVPDAEPNATLGQVARDAERLPRIRVHSPEELDQLATLWGGAPGAVAVGVREFPATASALCVMTGA